MTATKEPTTVDNADRLVNAVLAAHQTLATNGPAPDTITRILESVGRAADVDRAYIFAFRSNESTTILGSQRYEWSADNAEPQIDNPELQDIPMREAGYGRWLDRFLAYLPVAGRISEFPETERRLLQEQDIRSLIALPIYADAVLWGFVGFDDCQSVRVWSDVEVDMLLSVAISLGGALMSVPGGDHVFSRPTSNSRIAGYAAIAGGLLWAQDDASGLQAAERFSARVVETRMRTLVRTHQYLQSRSGDDVTVLEEYLNALQDPFHLITSELGVKTMVPPRPNRKTLVWAEITPAIGVLVAERLAAIRPEPDNRSTLDHLVIEVEQRDGTAVVVVRAFDVKSTPLRIRVESSASSLLFERRLLGHVGGEVRGPRVGISSEIGTFPTSR